MMRCRFALVEGATNSGFRSTVAIVVCENDARCGDDGRWFAAVVSASLVS